MYSRADSKSSKYRRVVRWLIVLLFICIVVAALRLSYGDLSMSWKQLVEHEDTLRQSIEQHWMVAFLLGFLLYTLMSLIPGTTGKSIVFGWLFGLWAGLAIVSLALTLAATTSFLVARYLLHDFVQHRFSYLTRFINQAFERSGALYLITLRLLHVPYSLVNYATGATGIPTSTFAWTTLVGMLPGNFAFVLAGSQLPTLQGIVEGGVWSLVDIRVFAALSAAVLIPLVAHKMADHLRSKFAHSSSDRRDSTDPRSDCLDSARPSRR